MDYKEMIRELENFTQKLQDEESQKIFDARFLYFINRDKDMFYEKLDRVLNKFPREYSAGILERYYTRNPENIKKDIVVFGGGEKGKMTIRALQYLKRNVRCICDNNKELVGKEFHNIPIYDFSYMSAHCKDCMVIIAVLQPRHQISIYSQLIKAGFSETDIFMNYEGGIYCDIAGQYFDLEQLYENDTEEYFVDAGCFNGKTSVQCADVFGEKLKMIYAFEPAASNYKVCEEKLADIGCAYELYENATWKEKASLSFDVNEAALYASKITNSGSLTVQADSIDNKLNGRKATYIKLDVEGSELETLEGAIKTIVKYRPKLAISIYHKPEDIIQIPVFLEKLNLGYQYYIRQYQTRMQETILYAL